MLDIHDEYHRDIVRSKLTRNIDSTFKAVRQELVMSMDDLIPTHGHGTWQSPRQEAVVHTACRVDNGTNSKDC